MKKTNQTKRLLGILLALVMVLGLMSGLVLTASATDPIVLDFTAETATIKWEDYTATAGYWSLEAENEEYGIYLVSNDTTQVAGTYAAGQEAGDLDYLGSCVKYKATDAYYSFIDGSITVAVDEDTIVFSGLLTAYDGATFDITITIELVEINLNADNAMVLWMDNADDGWQITGTSEDYVIRLSSDLSKAQENFDCSELSFHIVRDMNTVTDDHFTDGSCTVAVDGDIATVTGTFTGESGKIYNITLTNGSAPAEPGDEPDNGEDPAETEICIIPLTLDMIPENDDPFDIMEIDEFMPYSDDEISAFVPNVAGEIFVIYRAGDNGGYWYVTFENGDFQSIHYQGQFNSGLRNLITNGSAYYYTGAAPVHQHNYAAAWSNDGSTHWHACTGEGECDAPKSDEAAHTYGTTGAAGYTCTVCGYENSTLKAQYETNNTAASEGTPNRTDAGTTVTTGETPTTTETKEKKAGLSGGAIAGIIIGSIVAAMILACVVLYILDKKKIINFPFIDQAIKKIASIFRKK